MKKSTIKQINQDMKLRDSAKRIRKVPITSFQAPHTNFANEIQSLEKSDKFLDRAFYITCAICAVLAITLIIIK